MIIFTWQNKKTSAPGTLQPPTKQQLCRRPRHSRRPVDHCPWHGWLKMSVTINRVFY